MNTALDPRTGRLIEALDRATSPDFTARARAAARDAALKPGEYHALAELAGYQLGVLASGPGLASSEALGLLRRVSDVSGAHDVRAADVLNQLFFDIFRIRI